jgi:hypothetical protein
MQHPLVEFVTRTAPKRCGVHPAFGRVAEMVLYQEALGEPVFSAVEFETARDRARLAMPYNPVDADEYEKCLDVIEMAILRHRKDVHGIDAEPERMETLDAALVTDSEAVAVVQSDWWVL